MLTKSEHDYRIGKFTGSLANSVMNATTEAELVRIWRIKVGLDDPEPETYAMRAGSHMEKLILDERELQTGHTISRRGEIIDHPTIPDICVKLDGYRAHDDAVIDAKFVGPHRGKEEIYRAYYPQMILQMLTAKTRNAVLAVAQGTSDPVEYEITFDANYAAELLRRAAAFLVCMRTMTPPCPLPEVLPPEKWRIIDLAREAPNWGDEMLAHLSLYEATAEYATAHDEAGAKARALVPEDVAKVIAGQFVLDRNRRGIVSIRANRR